LGANNLRGAAAERFDSRDNDTAAAAHGWAFCILGTD
jgi:hypothetical protein